MPSDEELVAIKERAAEQLMRLPGVNAVGIGGRVRGGKPTGEVVLKVFVEEKKPLSDLAPGDVVPAQFEGVPKPSGAAIFVPPTHPDFPPMWLTRHYGVLCLGWPGVQEKTFPAEKPIHCQYRVWVHRGSVSGDQIRTAYEAYSTAMNPPPPPPGILKVTEPKSRL